MEIPSDFKDSDFDSSDSDFDFDSDIDFNSDEDGSVDEEPSVIIEEGAKAPGDASASPGDGAPKTAPKPKKKRTKRKRPKVPATCQKCGVHFQSKPNLITHMKVRGVLCVRLALYCTHILFHFYVHVTEK